MRVVDCCYDGRVLLVDCCVLFVGFLCYRCSVSCVDCCLLYDVDCVLRVICGLVIGVCDVCKMSCDVWYVIFDVCVLFF